MSNAKISALTAATTPLAGTEVLPVVQSGATKQVSVANLTDGRAVNALSMTLTTGLAATSGGTGSTSAFVANAIPYASSTTVLSTSANFTYNGTNFYLNGGIGIGAAVIAGYSILSQKNITGATTSYGMVAAGSVQSDVTAAAIYYSTSARTQATAFTLTSLQHYAASQGTLGVGSTVTSQYGFIANSNLTGATNNYGFYGNIASATGAWNLYMAGTADNYVAGRFGIGSNALSTATFRVSATISGATTSYAGFFSGTIQPTVTAAGYYNATSASTAANGGTPWTLTSIRHYAAIQGSFNADSTVTSQYGFIAESSLTGATNNYGFYGSIASAANRYNFYAGGTAPNWFSGDVLVFGAGGLGYTTGSGGTVTQATSRTTGVTINKTNGAITLVSAAGSTTYQTFTVTNSTVAATDVIHVCQKSGTDKYIILVTAVAAGSFAITFATTGGVTVEQPVFNFAVIKAVTA